MNANEINETWRSAGSLGNDPRSDFNPRKSTTALDRLILKYNRFSRLGLLMMVIGLLWMFNHSFPQNLRLWTGISFIIYFGICSTMDFWLGRGLKTIDCYTMTVREVIDKALYYRRKHHQFMIILIPMAIVVIGGIIYKSMDNIYLIYGAIAGIIVGAFIGFRQYLEFMAEYRTIIKNDNPSE